MQNKLSYKFAQGLNKLRTANTFTTLISSREFPLLGKFQHLQIRANKGDSHEILSNLLQNESRTSLFCRSLRTEMNEAKTTLVKTGDVFRLSDYDCVGFDLDNTICRYKLSEMVKLEYDILSQYLVKEKGYNEEFLLKPIEDDMNFVQKGLVLDFAQGNVLQINSSGYVLKASHGTKQLSNEEIVQVYGEDRHWGVAAEFTSNMLEAWNGPLSEKIRTLLDYFDMPASLVFARVVDSLDAKGNKQNIYNVWPDVLDGLIYMFRRENFVENTGEYFPAMKADPLKYINRCSDDVLNWLKLVKKEKITFLITGSHVDFASLVASTSMGDNWRDLFDVVVCYARKPGFFTGGRPFVTIEGMNEGQPLKGTDLKIGNIYSQGNWQDLYGLFSKVTGKQRPKCVYIGDNLIQDVYTPSEFTACDTVAVVEEMLAEGMCGCESCHIDESVLVSNVWGSYFSSTTGPESKQNRDFSIWADIIRRHSKLCVPSLEVMSQRPMDFNYPAFVLDDGNRDKQSGYYPNKPLHLKFSDSLKE